jgi:hypothetical protein
MLILEPVPDHPTTYQGNGGKLASFKGNIGKLVILRFSISGLLT